MLFKVYVQNFRTIKSLELSLLRNYVSIVGENASGKSNVLTAVNYLLGFNNLPKVPITNLCRVAEPTRQIYLGGELAEDVGKKRSKLLLRLANFENLEREVYFQTKMKIHSDIITPELVNVPSNFSGNEVPRPIYIDPVYNAHNETDPDLRMLFQFYWPKHRLSEIQDISELMERLWCARNGLKVIIFDSNITDDTGAWTKLIINDPYMAVFPTRTLSSGFRHTYRIAVSKIFFRNQNCLLIVDEPEQHLSRPFQIRMSKWLKEMSSQTYQILIATHSQAFVSDDPQGTIVLYRNHGGITSRYRPDNSIQDSVITRRLTGWAMGGEESSNVHILVEGPGDEHIFGWAIEKLKENAKDETMLALSKIKPIYMIGHDNSLYWKHLHNKIGIPCLLILDDDTHSRESMKKLKKQGLWNDSLDRLVPRPHGMSGADIEDLFERTLVLQCFSQALVEHGYPQFRNYEDFIIQLQKHSEWNAQRWSELARRLVSSQGRRAKDIIKSIKLTVAKKLTLENNSPPGFVIERINCAIELHNRIAQGDSLEGLPYVGITPNTWAGPGLDPVSSDVHHI